MSFSGDTSNDPAYRDRLALYAIGRMRRDEDETREDEDTDAEDFKDDTSDYDAKEFMEQAEQVENWSENYEELGWTNDELKVRIVLTVLS